MCGALPLVAFPFRRSTESSPYFDLTTVRRMLSFGGGFQLSIIGTATIYCDRFLLGMWVGMAAVTSYGMPLDLISRLQLLITSFCTVLVSANESFGWSHGSTSVSDSLSRGRRDRPFAHDAHMLRRQQCWHRSR